VNGLSQLDILNAAQWLSTWSICVAVSESPDAHFVQQVVMMMMTMVVV